jgi:hypothetical protein
MCERTCGSRHCTGATSGCAITIHFTAWLCGLQLLVCHHDRELGSHLQQLGVPFLQHLWQQLSGAMSELLPQQQDWLVFWDHCLGAAAGPSFMYSLLTSYLIAQRQLLLAVENEQQLQTFLKSKPPVDIRKVSQLKVPGTCLLCRQSKILHSRYITIAGALPCFGFVAGNES